MDISTFNITVPVFETECDFRGELTPGAYLRYVQEIAGLHCSSIGLTSQVYTDTNAGFMLAKLSLDIIKPIKAGSSVRVCTRASAPKYSIYSRYTEFFVGDELMAYTSSRWVLVDATTHSILKKPPENFPMPFDALLENKAIKIEKAPACHCGTATASYSRCDINMHVNNTRYIDIVCDMLPEQELLSHSIKKIIIVYHNELPIFKQMEIARGIIGSSYYLSGNCGERSIFEANAAF